MNFISIWIHKKSYNFLKANWTYRGTTRCLQALQGTVHKRHVVWCLGPNVIPYDDNGIVLQNLRWHTYIFEKSEKNKKSKKKESDCYYFSVLVKKVGCLVSGLSVAQIAIRSAHLQNNRFFFFFLLLFSHANPIPNTCFSRKKGKKSSNSSPISTLIYSQCQKH
jgi:hypothetical protein